MTNLELYKFITENEIEYHYTHDKTNVYMFVENCLIKYFYDILEPTIFDEDGIICHMKDGYFAFEMYDICEYYGIELNGVFTNLDA